MSKKPTAPAPEPTLPTPAPVAEALAPTGTWANRITRTGMVAVADLIANPRNWRLHPQEQQEALFQVLGEVGWVSSVLINEETGRMVDGHLRALVAKQNGEEVIPATWVRLTADEEAKVLTLLDPLAGLAQHDDEALARLTANDPLTGRLGELLANLRHLPSEPPTVDGSAIQDADVPNTTVKIGEIVFLLDGKEYLQWQAEMRQRVGLNKDDLLNDVLRRLGLCN